MHETLVQRFDILWSGLPLMLAGETPVEASVSDVNEISRTNGPGTIEIAVADRGRGLPAGDEDRIFDPFFTTKPDGMGMDLSISRTIVEAHGGRLCAENGAARGATFQFTLPSQSTRTAHAG